MTNKLYLISDDEGPIIWEVRFEPSTGERNSVEDYIRRLPSNKIIFVYACRKVSQKAKAQDIARAKENLKKYVREDRDE